MNQLSKKHTTDIDTETILVCKDHLVSEEEFEIRKYKKGILKTFPVPEDLSKYYESQDYISHSDSKKGIQNRLYQIVKSHMLSKKAEWIIDFYDSGSILDYGAGTGDFLIEMKNRDWKVEGVEPNKSARDLGISKGVNLQENILKLENKFYDVISLWHVLEHIPDYPSKISDFDNLLKEDGILVIAVPNYNSYDSEYYRENWAAWDTPRHLWHFSRSGIRGEMEKLGFELVKEKPLKFDSYYVSLLSEKNRDVVMNPLNALYRGFLSNLKAKQSGEYSSVVYFFKKASKTQN